MSAHYRSNLWRLGPLAAITLTLLIAFFSVVSASRHFGGNGPDGVQYPLATQGNCAPYLFGRVYVDGAPVSGALLTLEYLTRTITATTLTVEDHGHDPRFTTQPTDVRDRQMRTAGQVADPTLMGAVQQ